MELTMTDAAKIQRLIEVYQRGNVVLKAGAAGKYGAECQRDSQAAQAWIAGLMDIEPAGEWPEGT